MLKLKDLLILEQVFDVDQAKAGVDIIKKKIKAPFVNAAVTTLGGADRPSIGINISLDDKSKWKNNIFHNSRYMVFMLDWNGKLKLLTAGDIDSHTERPSYDRKNRIKFRQATVKSIDDAINKINKAIEVTEKASAALIR